jgi:hypothetical protein
MEKGQPLRLSCADLDHLNFLPSGAATLTRRSRRHSRLSAVVVGFVRTRKRYERQGILAAPEAIEEAEKERLDDAELREVRHRREALRRAEQDQERVASMAQPLTAVLPWSSLVV